MAAFRAIIASDDFHSVYLLSTVQGSVPRHLVPSGDYCSISLNVLAVRSDNMAFFPSHHVDL